MMKVVIGKAHFVFPKSADGCYLQSVNCLLREIMCDKTTVQKRSDDDGLFMSVLRTDV